MNEKGTGDQHKARFLTRAAIDALRARREKGTLDFCEDILPLIVREMCLAKRIAERRDPASLFLNGPDTDELAFIQAILDPLHGRHFADLGDFRAFTLDYMRKDIAQAALGNRTSPVKAATDVIRDVRDNLRYAVEQGGLSPQSHRDFLARYVPTMNRIAVGPPKSRVEEWMALMRAGLLQIGGGPGARLIPEEASATFVIETSFANGMSRVGDFAPGGLDISSDNHLRDRDGNRIDTIWALGTPTEGANFYTFILPRPHVNSRFISDAGHAVNDLIVDLKARAQRQAEARIAPDKIKMRPTMINEAGLRPAMEKLN